MLWELDLLYIVFLGDKKLLAQSLRFVLVVANYFRTKSEIKQLITKLYPWPPRKAQVWRESALSTLLSLSVGTQEQSSKT